MKANPEKFLCKYMCGTDVMRRRIDLIRWCGRLSMQKSTMVHEGVKLKFGQRSGSSSVGRCDAVGGGPRRRPPILKPSVIYVSGRVHNAVFVGSGRRVTCRRVSAATSPRIAQNETFFLR